MYSLQVDFNYNDFDIIDVDDENTWFSLVTLDPDNYDDYIRENYLDVSDLEQADGSYFENFELDCTDNALLVYLDGREYVLPAKPGDAINDSRLQVDLLKVVNDSRGEVRDQIESFMLNVAD